MPISPTDFRRAEERLRRVQGTAEWDSIVRGFMQQWATMERTGEAAAGSPFEIQLQGLAELLTLAYDQDPGRFAPIAEQTGLSGFAQAEDTASVLDVINAELAGILSGAGVSNDRIEAITRNITENISEKVSETTRRRIQERINTRRRTSGRFRVVGEETTQRRIDRFIDIPTPEEFLDSFEVSFAGFLNGLEDAGVDRGTIDFVRGEEEFFLNEFLGDLAERAAAGEDIFRVVGTEPGQVHTIGERFGGETRESITGREVETGDLTETEITNIRRTINETERTKIETRIREEVREEQRRSGGSVDPLTITEIVNRRTNQEINRRVTEETSRRTRERTTSRIERTTDLERTEITRERLLTRPRLATIFATSPQEFLEGQFSPESITTLAAGRRGTRQRAAETATGPPVTTPRRVF